MRQQFAATIFCFALFLALPVWAQAYQPVKVGDTAPSIATIDQDGAPQSLETLSGEKGLMLAFIRSVEWCPYCQKQVKDIDARQDDFHARGYNVAVLSYDAPETAKSFAEKNGIGLTILSDRRSEIIDAFGLLNTEYPKGTRFYGIPHPAIYVIAPDGKVTGYFAEESYKIRPDLDEVLASLGPVPVAAPPPVAGEPPAAEQPVAEGTPATAQPEPASLPVTESVTAEEPEPAAEPAMAAPPAAAEPPMEPSGAAPATME